MRPEGLVNPYGSLLDRTKRLWSRWDGLTGADIQEDAQYCAFEAGADAMLEGLKKEGRRIDVNEMAGENCYVPYLVTLPAKGVLVFIPEEQ